MREHEIGPVIVELRQIGRSADEWDSEFRILTVDGRDLIAQGRDSCPMQMDPEGLQAAYETLLWMTTEDAGDPDDPEWQALCRERQQAIVDDDLWYLLLDDMADYAMQFEQAAWDVEDGRTENE